MSVLDSRSYERIDFTVKAPWASTYFDASPEQRTEPHFLRPATGLETRVVVSPYRGNPRRLSLNIPSKIVRPN